MRAGLTGIDHADNPAIDEAAAWLAVQGEPPRPLVPALHQRFGLTPLEACEACARAQNHRYGAADGSPKE